ncbi:MAG: TRAP transporter small permease subunit [Firmicutes bacterium]|nr:TRAP transporter small permease subunit [Bacillota bacterium]
MGRYVAVERDVPVVCGGVRVAPGDIVVADQDGVVVVPIAIAEDVLKEALSIDEREGRAWPRRSVKAHRCRRSSPSMPASETPVSRGPGETLWCRVEGGLVRINQGAVIVMFAVMFVLVFVNVVTRYLFRFSIPWAEEVAGYLLVWMAYLGAGLALREGRHVAVTAVQRALPERIARRLRDILVVVTFAFLILLAYAGIRYARLAWPQKTPILRAPLGAVYLAIPAGVLTMALHLVSVVAEHVSGTLGNVKGDPSKGEAR